jgi:cephalosporin hydroxylase
MLSLRELVEPGDYMVVEDGNINGHPVLPRWGEGPTEALQAYFDRYPEDYTVDAAREAKFGFTFAPSGFLLRN